MADGVKAAAAEETPVKESTQGNSGAPERISPEEIRNQEPQTDADQNIDQVKQMEEQERKDEEEKLKARRKDEMIERKENQKQEIEAEKAAAVEKGKLKQDEISEIMKAKADAEKWKARVEYEQKERQARYIKKAKEQAKNEKELHRKSLKRSFQDVKRHNKGLIKVHDQLVGVDVKIRKLQESTTDAKQALKKADAQEDIATVGMAYEASMVNGGLAVVSNSVTNTKPEDAATKAETEDAGSKGEESQPEESQSDNTDGSGGESTDPEGLPTDESDLGEADDDAAPEQPSEEPSAESSEEPAEDSDEPSDEPSEQDSEGGGDGNGRLSDQSLAKGLLADDTQSFDKAVTAAATAATTAATTPNMDEGGKGSHGQENMDMNADPVVRAQEDIMLEAEREKKTAAHKKQAVDEEMKAEDEAQKAKIKRIRQGRADLGLNSDGPDGDDDEREALADPEKAKEERLEAKKQVVEQNHKIAKKAGHSWPVRQVRFDVEPNDEAIVRHQIGMKKVDEQLATVDAKLKTLKKQHDRIKQDGKKSKQAEDSAEGMSNEETSNEEAEDSAEGMSNEETSNEETSNEETSNEEEADEEQSP